MKRSMLLGALLFGVCFGCGGSGSGPPPTATPAPGTCHKKEIVSWVQPLTLADNVTPLDIQRDVSHWEIYCTFFPPAEDRNLVANVASPDNLAFDLTLLRAHGIVPDGAEMFVFLKCVGKDNQVSDFSEPVIWEGMPVKSAPNKQSTQRR